VRSLRVRLSVLFLLAVLIAGGITTVFAIRFFQDYTKDRTLGELRRQASGLADLYRTQAVAGSDAPRFAAPILERATGSRIYYAGIRIFPGQISGLRHLDEDALDWTMIESGRAETLEFVPPGSERTYLAAAEPIELGGETFGALIVAKPRAELQERWLSLLGRLGLAFLVGLAVAAGLVGYLTRRLTQPLLALSRAADEVAQGRYESELPRARSRDEVGHLTERFREMTERLGEAQRHERNFLMLVSHELRTPVTAIRGHLDALREGLADDVEAREASLAVIHAETDRLARLVRDILDLARLDAHRFTLEKDEVDLRRLVEQAYASFSEEARRRGIQFDCVLGAEPVLETDGDRVLQIVSNLLDNAFAWTPDGGKITLELGAANGLVSVAVADSGPGIGKAERERIFRPFWSRTGEGTGLGLPIARELAQALGGRLDLESEVGRGSRFELRLPARAAGARVPLRA
jgi:signal transduction histidine kinase